MEPSLEVHSQIHALIHGSMLLTVHADAFHFLRSFMLQDPVARAYLAWKKAYDITCPSTTAPCNMAPFPTTVKNSIAASTADDCLFNTPVCSPLPVFILRLALLERLTGCLVAVDLKDLAHMLPMLLFSA